MSAKPKTNKTHGIRHTMASWVETFCGRTLYPTKVSGEYDDAIGRRFAVEKNSADATCAVCQEMREQDAYDKGLRR